MSTIRLGEYTTAGNQQALVDMMQAELQGGAHQLVLDLTDAVYIDAAALNTLVDLARRVREHGGSFRLVNPNDDLRVFLTAAKLEALLGLPEAEPNPPSTER